MENYKYYLDKLAEVGTVEKVTSEVAYVKGIPNVRPYELVVTEDEQIGQVISISEDFAEVMMITGNKRQAGMKVARTSQNLEIEAGDNLVSHIIDPLGNVIAGEPIPGEGGKKMRINKLPPDLASRQNVEELFEVGVPWVDLVVPLGKGQRELVVGDRKLGKTSFLLQAVKSHALKGGKCVIAGIGRRQKEVMELNQFLGKEGIWKQVVVVVSFTLNRAGMVFLTPYTAMAVAEYFRDKGEDVLLVLDDLSSHAKYYREISLLARRFPGRSAYPGDIYFQHARLLERAGKFAKGSITCLPVSETVLNDISGYIQTNLMSMTDGHILFDTELYNQGRRPPINSALSVTRVGHQTQTPLYRSASRELSSFLSKHSRIRQLVHFGGEINMEVQKTLDREEKLMGLFNQPLGATVPINAGLIYVAGVWANIWPDIKGNDTKVIVRHLMEIFSGKSELETGLIKLISQSGSFNELVQKVKNYSALFELGSKT